MIFPFENDTSAMTKKLAKRSLLSSKMKTVFSLVAIALSVGLLSGIILAELGYQTAEQRTFQTRQHVLYEKITEEQAMDIREDSRVSDSMLYKQGDYTLEVDDYLLLLSYSSNDAKEIEMEQIAEGEYPRGLYEVAVDKAYLKHLGLPQQLGQSFTVEWLDGTKETFTVVGLMENAESTNLYGIYVSEEYARNGSQLKDTSWNIAVRLHNADDMNATEFREAVRSLGTDYGLEIMQINELDSYVSSKSLSQNDIIIFLTIGIGVLFVSVLVIYNIFYISVVSSIRQFGQMRALGATTKQIRRVVRREGTILWLLGTPIGFVMGSIVAFLVRPDGWSWHNVLIVMGVVFVADYITVQFSIRKPAKMAAMVSPVDALRMNADTVSTEKKKSRKLHRKLTPMCLAKTGIARNRKTAIVTVLSLGVSGILFIVGFSLLSAVSEEEYARQGILAFGEVEVVFSSNAANQSSGGYTGLKMENPMDDNFEEQLLKIDGVESVKRFSTLDVQYSYKDVTAEESVGLLSRSEWERIMKYAEGDGISYDDAVAGKDIIFINNGVEEEIFGWNYEVGDNIKLRWYNGTEDQTDDFLLGTAISRKIYQSENDYDLVANVVGFYMPEDLAKNMMPEGYNFTDIVAVKTDCETMGNTPAEQVAAFLDAYPTLRYTTLEDEMQYAHNIFQTLYGMILGMCLFVIGFSLMNLFNTMLTNIFARKREFVMLRSLGMSRKQLFASIRDEGLIYSCCNMGIALFVGVPIGWLIIHLMRQTGAFYLHWKFPVLYLFIYALITSTVPLLIAQFAAKSIQGDNLAEQLRTTE
jgi:putative ABC transport system permease protein